VILVFDFGHFFLSIFKNPFDFFENNFIQASANYIDESYGFITTITFVDYKVQTASGLFKG